MKIMCQSLMMLFITSSTVAQSPANTVNPIIGDESYVALFGSQPGVNTDNHLRVATHLFYVEQLLRQKSTESLSEEQKTNRETVLNYLHDYRTRGVFPANYDYPNERKPCFIDKDGTICAVGYLIEKTAGIETARQINEAHQYDYLLDMHSPVIAAWAEANGFTLEECAMIQPTYGSPIPSETIAQPVKKGYGISSGFVSGFNLAMSTLNFSNRFGNNKTIAYIGFVSGASQIIMGVTNIKDDAYSEPLLGGPLTMKTYKAQNNLSYFNIAMGTTTMVTSVVNLLINSKVKDKRNAINIYSYPGLNNEMNLGLSVARKL